MKYKKKFEPNGEVKSVEEAVGIIIGKGYIFYNHKPYHYGWSRAWPVSFIENAISQGRLFKAKEIQDGRKETGDGSSLNPEG